MKLSDQLIQSEYKYSPTIVRDIIRSNRGKYGYVRPETKKIIFFMMKRIVLRGAGKFFAINKNRNNQTFYEYEDIINELYIVLSLCADKFNVNSGKDFYLYFNSSVSRRISRMSNYKRVNNSEYAFSEYFDEGESNRSFDDLLDDGEGFWNEDMFWEDMQTLSLTDDEFEILKSTCSTNKLRDITRDNGITRTEYLEKMEVIRDKINKEYINGY